MEFVIYLITGLLAGVIGGLLGTGGCALMMPVVRFGFHFDPALAVGTTLTAVVFTAAAGAYQHIKMKNVDRTTALRIGASGVLGVILGSVAFGYLKDYGRIIDLIIGVAFIIVALRMLFEGLRGGMPAGQEATAVPGSTAAKSGLGASIGFLTGIIGLGGGYALVPSLIYFLGSPVKLAIGTSMAAFVWMAIVGSAFKLYQQVVNVPVAVTLGIGAAVGAVFGAKLVARFNPNLLKALFGLLFLYVSLKYLLLFVDVHI
jgi:hypothetical protein